MIGRLTLFVGASALSGVARRGPRRAVPRQCRTGRQGLGGELPEPAQRARVAAAAAALDDPRRRRHAARQLLRREPHLRTARFGGADHAAGRSSPSRTPASTSTAASTPRARPARSSPTCSRAASSRARSTLTQQYVTQRPDGDRRRGHRGTGRGGRAEHHPQAAGDELRDGAREEVHQGPDPRGLPQHRRTSPMAPTASRPHLATTSTRTRTS